MLTINVITTKDEKLITGSVNSEKFNVPFTEDLFDSLVVKQNEYEELTDNDGFEAWVKNVGELLENVKEDIIETACPDLKKDKTGKYFVVVKGVVSKKAVPEKLVKVILESVEKDINADPIVKAWIRFMRNPNFTVEKANLFADYITAEIIDYEEHDRLIEEEGFISSVARQRATYNDVAITKEGLIVTKKYAKLRTEGYVIDPETNKAVLAPLFDKEDDTIDEVTGEITQGKIKFPDFAEELSFLPPVMGTSGDKFICEVGDKAEVGHLIKVGGKHTLENWDQVNCNDSQSCVKGLHVGRISTAA